MIEKDRAQSRSRRQALALAAALTATVLTAIAAVGGLSRWSGTPRSVAPVASQVVQQVPAPAPAPAQPDEMDD